MLIAQEQNVMIMMIQPSQVKLNCLSNVLSIYYHSLDTIKHLEESSYNNETYSSRLRQLTTTRTSRPHIMFNAHRAHHSFMHREIVYPHILNNRLKLNCNFQRSLAPRANFTKRPKSTYSNYKPDNRNLTHPLNLKISITKQIVLSHKLAFQLTSYSPQGQPVPPTLSSCQLP